MKKFFLLSVALFPLFAVAQETNSDWRDADKAKLWVQTRLTSVLASDSAIQAAVVGAMAPFADFGVTAALPVPEGVRVALWIDRVMPGTLGTQRFNTTMLLIDSSTIDPEHSFLLAEAEETTNAWSPVRSLLLRLNQTDDSIRKVAQGASAEVYNAYHTYFQNQLTSLSANSVSEAEGALNRLQVIQRECAEFLRLRASVESAHTELLKDYKGEPYTSAMQTYKNHYMQCDMRFDPQLGRSEVRRLRELSHVQHCFSQYAATLLVVTRKNQQMDSTYSNGMGVQALGEYKQFYMQYNQSFDPTHDSASVEQLQELSRQQDDYMRFVELRTQLAFNNAHLEARTEKPYAKMMSDYKKFYSLLNQKMSVSAVETNTRLQKAVETQELYMRCISLCEHTLSQHELMTTQVEKACKDVIKVYKSYYKSNKPIYSGSVTVYDRQLTQLAAMQRAFRHMAILRQQIDSKNAAIDVLSERWNKPVVKAYESVFEVLNLEVTPDTNYSITYLKGIIDMQDSCISFIHRYHKVIENNDVIENQKSKAKHIVKAYQGYYEEADLGWEAKKECYKKLDSMLEVQQVFIRALQRDDIEALDKSIKAMRKPSFETILNTLR